MEELPVNAACDDDAVGFCKIFIQLPYVGLMHTLFALEDIYGLKISRANGKICLQLYPGSGEHYFQMLSMLEAWQEQKDKLEAGEITEDDYDRWRYR